MHSPPLNLENPRFLLGGCKIINYLLWNKLLKNNKGLLYWQNCFWEPDLIANIYCPSIQLVKAEGCDYKSILIFIESQMGGEERWRHFQKGCKDVECYMVIFFYFQSLTGNPGVFLGLCQKHPENNMTLHGWDDRKWKLQKVSHETK